MPREIGDQDIIQINNNTQTLAMAKEPYGLVSEVKTLWTVACQNVKPFSDNICERKLYKVMVMLNNRNM